MDLHINSIILKKLISILALIFISINVSAHNPNTASVIISPINGVWVVQFTISQQGANYALNNYYNNKDLNSIEIKEYKELYINYLRNKLSLIVDNKQIKLSSAGIKLGDHQTDIKFLLSDFPLNYSLVKLKLPIFEENKQQNTVVRFLENNKTIRKVMNKSNGFEMSFENSNNEFIMISVDENKDNKVIYFVLITILILGVGLYFFKIRNNIRENS